jgi:hypothetical protein
MGLGIHTRLDHDAGILLGSRVARFTLGSAFA